jgi:hypothetical protein
MCTKHCARCDSYVEDSRESLDLHEMICGEITETQEQESRDED